MPRLTIDDPANNGKPLIGLTAYLKEREAKLQTAAADAPELVGNGSRAERGRGEQDPA